MRGLVVTGAIAAVAVCGLATVTVRNNQDLKRAQAELEAAKHEIRRTQLAAFAALTQGEALERKRLQTNVGTIQFLGGSPPFTVELERADYRADGLELSGYLGNPNSLDIHGVTLQVELFRESGPEEFVACFPNDAGSEWTTVWSATASTGLAGELAELAFDCGTSDVMFPVPGARGQSRPIAVIRRGTREPFTLLVPNVGPKPKEDTYLHASLSGARFGY